MKRIFLVVALIIGLISCTNNKQQSAHNHDHSTHQHSESCSHNHDHSGHNHDHSSHNHNHSGHNHDAHSHEHNHGDDAITFSVEQQNKIDFEVVEVTTEPLYQIIRTSAQVVPAQEGEKILTATTSGIVNFEN